MIRVLIVDDSSVMRHVLRSVLSKDPGIQVVGEAPDPYVARELVLELSPDVITLDIEMPRMDGLAFLQILMESRPTPAVVVSSLTRERGEMTLKAFALGAVEVVGKPLIQGADPYFSERILTAVRTASFARLQHHLPSPLARQGAQLSANRLVQSRQGFDRNRLIAIGASTGGVTAIDQILMRLPAQMPPILVVQHLPALFTASLATRLNSICALEVKEAEQGEVLQPGVVYIGPGGRHLEVETVRMERRIFLSDGEKVEFQRPSVDVMFHSVAAAVGADGIGCILTGMGADGARGLLAMKQAGAVTIAQDEASCVVYGMPRVAVNLGAVSHTIELKRMAEYLVESVSGVTAHRRRERHEGLDCR